MTVFFPSGALRSFWFSHDLAGLFGLELNSEAEKLLKTALGAKPKGRLSIDHEADAVTVNASNAELMHHVLVVTRGLCADASALPPVEVEAAHLAMVAAPKPKRQKWAVGALFAVPLSDGTWTFGQIVDSPGPRLGMTQALYDYRAPEPTVAEDRLDELLTSRTLTILHTTSAQIEDGVFPIFSRAAVHVNPESGPLGPRSRGRSWDGIECVANAWHGLYPWNFFADPGYLDGRLMSGLKRPSTAWMLTADELAALRGTERYGPLLQKMIDARVRALNEGTTRRPSLRLVER